MSELDIVIESVKAALASAEASANSLRAVLRMLVAADDKPSYKDEPSECDHRDAVEVATMTGTARVCECGWVEAHE